MTARTAQEARPLDVAQARVARGRDGSVLFDDPASPWLVRVWIGSDRRGRRHITRLRVDARATGQPISAARLARLPTAHLLHVAAAQLAAALPDGHPNEAWYRMLATPRPRGQRSWDDSHWERVAAVYRWAEQTGRPGGGTRAVADVWGVSTNPTAYRWLAEVRLRGLDKETPDGDAAS